MSTLAKALAILNGTAGDYLVRTENALALPMEFIRDGRSLPLEREALAACFGEAPRIAVFVHGLMASEMDWRFPMPTESAERTDYGTLLACDYGFAPLYLRYNSGLSIAQNGRLLSRLLERTLDVWPTPVEEIALVGHSMGGLVARAACHAASEDGGFWLSRVRRAVYLGTPHRGAPAEKLGRVVTNVLDAIGNPYTKLIAQIADLRSDGIKDLGDAALRDGDRRGAFDFSDARHPVPLLSEIAHLLVAGSAARDEALMRFFGDGMVPIASATDGLVAAKILPGMLHMTLAHDARVYAAISAFFEETRS